MDDLPPRLRRLDRALISLDGDADPMLLSELDGFVAGILVCPDLILPGEWLPCVWGGGEEPVFGDIGDARQIVGMVMEHYNAVSADLNRGHGRYVPVFDIDIRHDETLWELWIEGFETAMALRSGSWDVIAAKAGNPAEALLGMSALIGIANDESDLPPDTVAALTAEAPDLIPLWVESLRHGDQSATGRRGYRSSEARSAAMSSALADRVGNTRSVVGSTKRSKLRQVQVGSASVFFR